MKDKEKKILLIICGGIAAYKSLELIRALQDENIVVQAVMTKSSAKFVTPLSVSSISGRKVLNDIFDIDSEMDFGHIELSRKADLILVVPATANIISKMANGTADDLASTILLATDKKVLIAPSMNVRMWDHPATKRNIAKLIGDGVGVIGPEEGTLACGEYGYGRMTKVNDLVEVVKKEFNIGRSSLLLGKRFLVTSGPTEEEIDPIRFISNKSSGIQGTAIATTLINCGAEVIFVTGPVDIPSPVGAKVFRVKTARDMLEVVEKNLPFDVAICAAAVGDWEIKEPSDNKLKKKLDEDMLVLEFRKTPDILASIGNFVRRPKLIIGFSAETENLLENAKSKLIDKGSDWILANDVSQKSGIMGGTETKITLISKNASENFEKMSKSKFSEILVERIISEIL